MCISEEMDATPHTCQCCCTDCHTATLPELLMATNCVPTKNRPSTGIFISNEARGRERRRRERGKTERRTNSVPMYTG